MGRIVEKLRTDGFREPKGKLPAAVLFAVGSCLVLCLVADLPLWLPLAAVGFAAATFLWLMLGAVFEASPLWIVLPLALLMGIVFS